MLKLHQLFFINFLLIFIATLLISGIVSYITLKDIQLNHFEESLKTNINIIEIELKSSKDSNLDRFSECFEKKSSLRITLIDKDGVVLTDSSQDSESMENHINRPEIKKAIKHIYGSSLRYSTTTKKNYLYVAKKIKLNNENIFIRMAMDTKRIMEDFYNLWLKVTLIFSLSVIGALFIKYYINKNIKVEVDKITDYLLHLTNKNYKPIVSNPFTEEFDTIFKLLKKMAKRLEKRDKQKKKFTKQLLLKNRQNREIISAMSHEFKNPVAVILGYSETLINDKDINENIRNKFLDKIGQNAKRISNIIDRITIAIKLENEDLTPKISKFDLKQLVEGVKNLLGEKYKDREIEIKGEDRLVEADRTLIELVLINLIDNALKYSEDDVTIEISEDSIKVIDRGIGIDSRDMDKVTQKFYRVDNNIWNNSLGLGLNIVEYILKMHSSHLYIESEIAKGSTFSFKI